MSPMITARLISGFALGFALLLAGCQTRSSIGEISVTVVDFQPTGSSLAEARAIMALRFINENLAPVAFTSSTHKLYLNGTYVGKVLNNQAVGIPAANTSTVDVSVFFGNPGLVRQLAVVTATLLATASPARWNINAVIKRKPSKLILPAAWI